MKNKTLIQRLLLIIFIGMMIAGGMSDEIMVVFDKGIRICLECIGIG